MIILQRVSYRASNSIIFLLLSEIDSSLSEERGIRKRKKEKRERKREAGMKFRA